MGEGEVDVTKLYDNLPDNSHKARNEKKDSAQEEKRVEKVVRGKVKTQKNNKRKLADLFISEDAGNVKNYIFLDVIIPAVKKAIYDLVVGALDMSLYGGRGGGGRRSTADKVSYRDYNSVSRRDTRSYESARTTSGYSYDDIILDSRGEAEEVLDKMFELLDTYQFVSVADLYDLVGITGNYTDNKYGWTNLRGAEPVRMRDGGYALKLPKAYPID